MHDKTQVFPLPAEDDVVHSRLTHSLEVASVGGSLGKRVGLVICQRHRIKDKEFDHHDVGDVVAAACLAHDIGNPPFGHAGEQAIAAFFSSGIGAEAIASLDERQKDDLREFEGNAQGFRVLTRLQLEADKGLRLTAATLAAFSKYPRESGPQLRDLGGSCTKKHGFFQEDGEIFSGVAGETGLLRNPRAGTANVWGRHPLAFIVEAADDICYSILDIEDGVHLGHVAPRVAERLLRCIASQSTTFSPARLNGFRDPKARVGYLRATAIGRLIEECASVFLDNNSIILEGKYTKSLGSVIPSHDRLETLKEVARTRCYENPGVIEIELAGYEVLGGLLEHFIRAVVPGEPGTRRRPEREKKALKLLQARGVTVNGETLYQRILRVTDFVSGMTDRYALATYRRLKGIAIPGRAG
jgi:dGTPase